MYGTLEKLECILAGAGHDTWGWVVYRCTYRSDHDWSEFINKVKALSRQFLDQRGATEAIADKQIWTFIDDRERLENANKAVVRRMFNDWVHSPEAAAEQPNARAPIPEVQLPRYLYCMHVDEASLQSLLDDSRDWHVNIINRHWIPEEEESDYEDSEDDEIPDEVRAAKILPEIEGCTEEDVGWMKFSEGILLGRYVALCKSNAWYAFYARPPQIAH